MYHIPACAKPSSETSPENIPVKKMILFFAGWGMDEKPFQHLVSSNYDVTVFYDYRVLHFNDYLTIFGFFKQYDEINIIAWSMGVWGANLAFESYLDLLKRAYKPLDSKKFLRKINKCIAINGTNFPISETWGIPQERYLKTVENLPEGIHKFNIRMCGSKNIYEKYMACASERATDELKEELIVFYEDFIVSNAIKWNKAIISTHDVIFPTINLKTFWEDFKECSNKYLKIIEIDEAHYPFFRWDTWDEILEM